KGKNRNGRFSAIRLLPFSYLEPLPHGRASDTEIHRPQTQVELAKSPPRFAVVAAGATIAVAIAASTTTPAPAAAVTAAASLSTAGAAISARARFIHSQVTTAEL